MNIRNKIMKYICIALAVAGLTSCAVDNMDAPDCRITGRIVSDGHQVGIRQVSGAYLNGSYVKMELWQSGFGKEAAQEINVAQDGTFSVEIYSGEARIITKRGVGPWENADTLRVKVVGDMFVEYPVSAYAVVSEPEIDYNAETGDFTAEYDLTVQHPEALVKETGVVVNNSRFVDTANKKIQINAKTTEPGHIVVTGNLGGLGDNPSLFARVFVKTDKSSYEAYSLYPIQLR